MCFTSSITQVNLYLIKIALELNMMEKGQFLISYVAFLLDQNIHETDMLF